MFVRTAATRAQARSPKTTAAASEAGGTTHRELTERFNALIPRANKLGVTWARTHTSAFETKALGVRQLARLEAAIAAARRIR
jgi:hypothetical protein